ncbi:MAG: hypothetical protein O7G88_17695 [bacterium]|nr:hypothetical protein [bacterium]
MSKAAVIGGLFAVVILAVIIFLSMEFDRYTCEVCVAFKGRFQCRTASGADRQTAVLSAHDNACAFLISSKTDGFLCSQTQPTKVVCAEP